MPLPDSESVYVIPGSVLLWKITPRPPNSAQVSYASPYWKCVLSCLSVWFTQSTKFVISKSGFACLLQQASPQLYHNCNFLMWVWKDNCHRAQSRISGVSLENGMLHVDSGMESFPTSPLHPASPLRHQPCKKSHWRALLEARYFQGQSCMAQVGVWRAVKLENH